jgi:hypothetical protein
MQIVLSLVPENEEAKDAIAVTMESVIPVDTIPSRGGDHIEVLAKHTIVNLSPAIQERRQSSLVRVVQISGGKVRVRHSD